MKNTLFIVFLTLFTNLLFAQNIYKPRGCYAGSNGTNPAALAHTESRGVLISERWANIETAPGVFNFSDINAKINLATNAKLKYTLAILGGTAGSPDWLIDTIGASYLNTTFQGKSGRLPLWWDSLVLKRLGILITELGNQFSKDSSLSHIYVTQMTSNGIEGHLNGVDMNSFTSIGFTNQKWVSAAKTTTHLFANAFPTIPIVFEVHEIDRDTFVPFTIINDLYADSNLCKRVGLAMWWISGKTTYQPNLIHFISNFKGDKYAQIIGRSDQTERFKDSFYGTVFQQAKELGIRYIEPWPYEFQYHTHDSLLQNFNSWTDTTFSAMDTCSAQKTTSVTVPSRKEVLFYPNPTAGEIKFQIDIHYNSLSISIFNLTGQKMKEINQQTSLDITDLQDGIYMLVLNIDNSTITERIIKTT